MYRRSDTELSAEPEREHWLRRLDATGKVQARYLWLTLIAGLFFAALRLGAADSQTITVPVVDVEIDALSVQASGGPILAFLVLATLGAIRAWTHALEQFRGASPAEDAEQLDISPNALDLAIYTTDKSPSIVRRILYFIYPTYLVAALVESGWLLVWTCTAPVVPARYGFMAAGAITWVPATILVLAMVMRRVRQVGDLGRTS